jgi:hypothetical protein
MNDKLKVLDLFSGIGGFSIAMKGCGAKTVAYCDIDENCRAVLAARMADGRLERVGKIFEDVKKIRGEDVVRLGANTITAGFPCVDISVAKPGGLGIRGSGSGLFKEVLRIIDESGGAIETVFLENSSNIVNPGKGYSYVRREMVRRGFAIRYCIVNAHMVGAYHKRLRWYCLCTRRAGGYQGYKEINWGRFGKWDWKRELDRAGAVGKLIRLADANRGGGGAFAKEMRVRCGMLGNSIVPQCAMLAWNTLIRGAVGGDGLGVKGEEVKIGKGDIVDVEPLNIVISDGEMTLHKRFWATPVKSIWYFYSRLTKRASTLLCNQIYYEVGGEVGVSDKQRLYREYICNPVFVEALMGYPANWTRV